MRAFEFIAENKNGKLNTIAKRAMKPTTKFKDAGSDRAYTLNRVMMATAVADGKSSKSVDINQASWNADYNTAHPYTQEEELMLQSAYNTVPSETHKVTTHKRSQEHPAVNNRLARKARNNRRHMARKDDMKKRLRQKLEERKKNKSN